MNLDVKFIKINKDAKTPIYAHDNDSGFDLFSCEDIKIMPNETKVVPTGLKFEIPEGYGIVVRPRSGNTLKGVSGCRVGCHENVNAKARVQIGTVDEGYRGEIGILTTNYESVPIIIPKGTKLAQGVLERIPKANFIEVSEFKTESERGEKGYGSTGR